MATSDAGITAVTWLGEIKVVVLIIPLNLTTEFELKLLPNKVIVKPPLPANVNEGEMVFKAGKGLVPVTVSTWVLEVPPPGVGLWTVMLKVPGVLISEALMVAFNWPEDTKDVNLGEPLKFTVELELKLAPLTVNVNAPPPAATDDGEIDIVAGVKLPTVNDWALEVPPLGLELVTVTLNVPVVVRSEDGIDAVNCVEDA